MNLTTDLCPGKQPGLLLKNPVITASGTFGYGTEYEHLFDIQSLGAVVCKGTTLEPRAGNPQPRITETPSGVLNAVGLQNIGIDKLIEEKAPVWSAWTVPVIVNIAGNSVEEYAEISSRLEGTSGISGIEINISCPNVKQGALEFGADPSSAASVTEAVRKNTSLPVWVKLTPNTADVAAIAHAVREAGADAVVLINTLKGMSVDIEKRRPVLGNITGGLSGPAIKPVALRIVYEVFSSLKGFPIIGSGGIMEARDAIEFFMAGASAVQIGTANLVNLRAPVEILEGIKAYMAAENLQNLDDLIGAAHRI
jgi:dihydroorotate dehydrogenase (NAD+) catalytic subunit